jgi:glycosyltransferase involved in cell wall biosynthesis
MPLKISVIICAHNPRGDILAEALASLRVQTLPRDQWELLLIDNASSQLLPDRFDLTWHPAGKHIREERLGLVHARLRGIVESTAGMIIFVDDDNLLAADYLEQAAAIGHDWPVLGVWGGGANPRFEVEPPEYLRPYLHMLALRDVEHDRWGNLFLNDITPWGAGMCIRRDIAFKYRDMVLDDFRRCNLDRQGSSLVSCGDMDMAYTAIDCGLGMGVFKRLQLVHIIPRPRLTEDYLLRLNEGNGYSLVWLKHFRTKHTLEQRPFFARLLTFCARSWLGKRLRFSRIERLMHESFWRGEEEAVNEIMNES